MVWKGIREKPHRLDLALYRGEIQCAFTIQTRTSLDYFNNAVCFSQHEGLLHDALNKWGCCAHLYVFMPDHVHLILEGADASSDTRACVLGYKQRAGYAFKRSKPSNEWQKDFYDHVIRNEADYRRQMNYFLMNPVRAGLAASWKEYPYWGSTVYRKEDLIIGVRF